MKKILLILCMLPLLSMGQMSKEYLAEEHLVELHLTKTKKTGSDHVEIHPGIACMAGGGMFMLLGVLTPRETEYVDGHLQNKPFYRQGAAFFGTITGGVLFMSGVVISIGQ